jgi:DNA-binding MarR family transcriptional regulator
MTSPGPRLLNRLLLRPALAMRVRIQRAIEAAGFDDFRIAHMNVFAWLPESGARIGELARQAQLSKQTLTELVASLEKHGYVYRTRDPSDGRAWIIRFTERGSAVHRVALRTLQDTEREWAQALGMPAYQQLIEHLERLLAVAEMAPEGGSLGTFADLSDPSDPALRDAVEDSRMTYTADPRVDAYIDALPDWQRSICREVRELVHAADPEVVETIKRSKQPYFVLRGNICALLAARDHVNVFLYDGAIVPDPEGIITAGHDNTTARTVAFRRGEPIRAAALTAMFEQIIANNRAGGWRKLKGA